MIYFILYKYKLGENIFIQNIKFNFRTVTSYRSYPHTPPRAATTNQLIFSLDIQISVDLMLW